jgi:hypothetical protein
MSRNRYLRQRNAQPWGAEPGLQPENVPRTEHEEARRLARDWLRERDENDVDEFDDGLAGPVDLI